MLLQENVVRKGDRVKIAPHCDLFMMGERYAEVVSVGRLNIYVIGERSGRRFMFRKRGQEDAIPNLTVVS